MFLVVCMITVIINLLFRTPEIAIIIQHLINGIIEILLITGQLTHTCQKRNCHECIVRPDSINVWPDAGNGTINQTRFTIIQMFGSLINVTQKWIIRILQLQLYQTGSHRSIIVQTFATEDHVPTQFADSIPTIPLKSFIILFTEEIKVTLVEYEVHILQDIFLILLITELITQFHQSHICYPIGIVPVIILASNLYIHIKR